MYRVILFDLDGTLTDPKPGITKSVQYALKKFGIIEHDLDKLTPFIGPPLVDSFQEWYSFSAGQAQDAVRFYREYFAEHGIYDNSVYPGMEEMLGMLKKQGKQLAVATSKPTVFAEQILRHFGLADYFSVVAGSNLDGTLVAKAEVIALALAGLAGADRETLVMVGDRKYDIIGACQHSIDSIAVTYGYGTLDELRQAQPTHIVDTVAQLSQLLRTGGKPVAT